MRVRRKNPGLAELPETLGEERRERSPILSPYRGGYGALNPGAPLMPTMPVPLARTVNPMIVRTQPPVTLPANVPVQLFANSRERCYSIIINAGANDAVITYERQPANASDGIPLASGGVGFHELVQGTVGTLWALSSSGTTLIVTEGFYDPPTGA